MRTLKYELLIYMPNIIFPIECYLTLFVPGVASLWDQMKVLDIEKYLSTGVEILQGSRPMYADCPPQISNHLHKFLSFKSEPLFR